MLSELNEVGSEDEATKWAHRRLRKKATSMRCDHGSTWQEKGKHTLSLSVDKSALVTRRREFVIAIMYGFGTHHQAEGVPESTKDARHGCPANLPGLWTQAS
jgi:hypothetical protein